jgi:hypothetical protein
MDGTERTRRTAQIRISFIRVKFLPADRRAEIAPAENVKIPVVMKLHEMLRTPGKGVKVPAGESPEQETDHQVVTQIGIGKKFQ